MFLRRGGLVPINIEPSGASPGQSSNMSGPSAQEHQGQFQTGRYFCLRRRTRRSWHVRRRRRWATCLSPQRCHWWRGICSGDMSSISGYFHSNFWHVLKLACEIISVWNFLKHFVLFEAINYPLIAKYSFLQLSDIVIDIILFSWD